MDNRGGASIQTTVCFTRLDIVSQRTLTYLPSSQGTAAYTLFATSPPGSKQRGRPNEPDFVGILLLMIRLETQQTDILVAINVPHIAGQYEPTDVDPEKGKHGVLLERAMQYRQKLLETFEIRDWGLFVTD